MTYACAKCREFFTRTDMKMDDDGYYWCLECWKKAKK